jgi:hypothetical protein
MTYTSVTTTIAKYAQIGKVLYFVIRFTGTTGGSAASSILIDTLPVLPTPTTDAIFGGACYTIPTTGSAAIAGTWDIRTTGTQIRVKKYDNSNWGLGSGVGASIQGFYPVA